MREREVYQQGLRFSCQRCGDCCRRRSGYLFLTAPDLRGLAKALEMSDEDFFAEYCEVIDLVLEKRVNLVESDDGGCVFYRDGGCVVYGSRPLQCRTFPFWVTNLESREAWDEVAAACSGVGEGALWSAEEIEQQLERRQEEPLLGLDD